MERGFERAAMLDAAGHADAARQGYLAILFDAPDHAATLNALGSLLCRTGYRSAGRTAYAQAAACHPDQPAGHVNLAHLLREDGDLAAARHHYEVAIDCAPGCPEAHQGLGNIFADLGQTALAERHWQAGYRDRVFTPWPYRGQGAPVRVLLLTSVTGGNIPVRPLLDDRVFAVVSVAMEFYRPCMPLPPHDLVVNAIGDADFCRRALRAVARLLARATAPVINPAAAVLATGRMENARRLSRPPCVVTPRMERLPRATLTRPGGSETVIRRGFAFPVLLRAPGFHTGQHFVRVAAAPDLAAAASALPGQEVLVIEPLVGRGGDGNARKCRVMIIDGQLYPLHLAISAEWKVHYFTAQMAGFAAHREEERRFLADMPGYLGPRAMAGLAWIAETLALDYGGIDFAIGDAGEVQLFEANATMAIVPPPPDPLWEYRRAACDAALTAAASMLLRRAGAAGV